MEVTLIKPWLNHPAGTIIKSVSPAILKELKELGAVENPLVENERVIFRLDELAKITEEDSPIKPEKNSSRKNKKTIKPYSNKMIGESPEKKAEDPGA